ncbi:Zinc finger protein VAR3, chloroplastic, partial [Cucurbita argyrosperma subsp. sororia]
MAQSPFSLLFLKRLSFSSRFSNAPLSSPLLSHFLTIGSSKRFFTSEVSSTPSSPSSNPKPNSLSARMSFIFDQIDAIEKERSQKDQTLQRIRAWRESKANQNPPVEDGQPESTLGSGNLGDNVNNSESALRMDEENEVERMEKKRKEIELVHPWPEWIELMERLVHQNYFDHRRKDENKMVEELGFSASDLALEEDVGLDLSKDFKAVYTACLNFGKDRFDILRSLSRKDIQILVGFGCPSPDKKVVFSAKLLRKLVHLDEGDVCSSCSLRNSCERAYLVTNKEDEARTIDIMRLLFTFGFDHMNGTVVNDSLLKQKTVKTVVRKLLHGVVKLGSVPIDPTLSPPVIKRPPPKVKQPPPPPKKRVGRDDVEMKKGDWLCPKCDFMNFAKNTVCLQCDAKRPKRQLLPGEWECPECNFLNYRRNMACFHCECKRPTDTFLDNEKQERQHVPSRFEKIANRQEVSNAWNFDFDDDESDGADVAAFEYADSSVAAEGSHADNLARGSKYNSDLPERQHSDAGNRGPGVGFDDFVDEEDDIDNYELDSSVNNSGRQPHSVDFSDIEGHSGSEDGDDFGHRSGVPSYNKRPRRQQAAFSDSEGDELDSDDDISAKKNWKSNHLTSSRQSRDNGRSRRGLSYGSDENLDSDLNEDLDERPRSRRSEGKDFDSNRKHFQTRGSSRMGGRSSESDFDDFDRGMRRQKLKGNQRENNRRGSDTRARGDKYSRGSEFQSNNFRNGRKNTFDDDFDDFGDKSHRSRGTNSRFRGNSHGGRGTYRSGSPKEGYKKDRPRRYNEYDTTADKDYGDFKNSRRVIER